MVEHQCVVAPEQPEIARAAGRLLPRRTPDQFGHPRRALDVGHGGFVVTTGLDPVDDLAQRTQRDGGLAQRWQHLLDVAHEDAARPDDQDAAAFVATPVAIEEVRRAVQRHDRLAGAGSARDRHDALGGCADRDVLLGLDGRHDRVHRPIAGAGQLRHQRALADDRQVGVDLGVEEFVLQSDDARPRATQYTPPDDVLRAGGRRLIEDRSGRSPPIDQQRVLLRIAQSDPADVAGRLVEFGSQVESSEDESLVRRIELGDALGRLEDHRVALDEATFVAESSAAVTLTGQRLGGYGRQLELAVDPVNDQLFLLDLLLDNLIAQR